MNGSDWYNLSVCAKTTTTVHQSSEFFVLMVSIMVCALLGNSSVLLVIFRSGLRHRPSTVFVISLAIGDIVTALLSISPEIYWDSLGEGHLGNIACKLSAYTQCLLFVGSAFVLVAMSYDCYEAICHPMSISRSVHRSRLLVLLSFLLAALLSIPQLFIFLQVESGVNENGQPRLACRSHGYSASWQRKLNVSWLAVCVFVAPLSTMTASGIKIVQALGKELPAPHRRLSTGKFLRRCSVAQFRMSKIKLRTIQLTTSVLLAHLLCWTPYFSVQLLNVWTDYRMKGSIPHAISVLSQSAAWFSSCVNPIIYAVFNLTIVQLRSMLGCSRLPKELAPESQSAITSEKFRARVQHVTSRLTIPQPIVHYAGELQGAECLPDDRRKRHVHYSYIS